MVERSPPLIQQGSGYQRFLKSVRANLRYWHSKLDQKSDVAQQGLFSQFDTVCRAIKVGCNFAETQRDSAEFCTSLFAFAEQSGRYAEWCLTLIAARQQLPAQYADLRQTLLSQLGQFYKLNKQLELALTTQERVLAEAAQHENALVKLKAHTELAGCCIELRRFDDADKQIQLAQAQLEQITVPIPTRARQALLNNLAWLTTFYHQQPAAGEKLYLEKLRLCDEETPRIVHVQALRWLAESQMLLGRPDEALVNLHSAEKLLASTASVSMLADIQIVMGNVYFAKGMWAEAAASFGSVPLAKLEMLGYTELQAIVHNNLGNVQQMLGQYDLSKQSLRTSMRLSEGIADNVQYANSLGSLGCTYVAEGSYEQGLDTLAEALSILRSGPQTANIALWIEEFETAMEKAQGKLNSC